jgi:hypothetical protein
MVGMEVEAPVVEQVAEVEVVLDNSKMKLFFVFDSIIFY